MSGHVSILRGIAIYPPSTRARRTLYSSGTHASGIDGYQVLYISTFSYVCTLISCALITQGRGRVGLLLLLSIQRGRARSIYRAVCTAGYPPLSKRHPVGGRVSVLRGIVVCYPPWTRLRRRLYSSRLSGVQYVGVLVCLHPDLINSQYTGEAGSVYCCCCVYTEVGRSRSLQS